MIFPLAFGRFGQFVAYFCCKLDHRGETSPGDLHEARAETLGRLHCHYRPAHRSVGCNESVHSLTLLPEQIELTPELVELERSSNPVLRQAFADLMRFFQVLECSGKASSILSGSSGKCHPHNLHFVFPYLLFVDSCKSTLAPRDVDRYCYAHYAANRLNPCRPIDVERRAGLWWVLAQKRPYKECARKKGHQRNHRPIPVCTSLLHEFPLLVERILPLGGGA